MEHRGSGGRTEKGAEEGSENKCVEFAANSAGAVTWDSTLRTFLKRTEAGEPVPGGGSASAVTAALGAAMTAMAANFSQGEPFADVRERMAGAAAEMRLVIGRCEELLTADIEAFGLVVEAYGMPRETEEERRLRSLAVRETAELAIGTPMRMLRACRDGIRIAHELAGEVNGNVASDLGIGAVLFEAAAQAAHMTVVINLAAVGEEEEIRRYRAQAEELLEEIGKRKEETVRVVMERIGG